MPDGSTDFPAPVGTTVIPALLEVAYRAGMTILAPEEAPA